MNRTRTGLALLALLSLGDVAEPVLTDGDHPPIAIALVAAVIGLASLVLVWYAARGARRAVAPLLGLRALSALTAVPAFFADDVPAAARTLAAVFVALTAVAIALVATPARAEARRTVVAR
jgi:low temperature requirement protein LtrA